MALCGVYYNYQKILIDLTQQTQITYSGSCLSLWERCPDGAEWAFSLSVTAFGRASSPKGRAKRIQVDKHYYQNMHIPTKKEF